MCVCVQYVCVYMCVCVCVCACVCMCAHVCVLSEGMRERNKRQKGKQVYVCMLQAPCHAETYLDCMTQTSHPNITKMDRGKTDATENGIFIYFCLCSKWAGMKVLADGPLDQLT